MLGDLLPAALGIALSPPPIIAVVVLLGTPRARITGPAFAFGWILGLAAVVAVASLVFDDAEKQVSAASVAETGLDGTSTTIVVAAFVMLCSVITVGAVLFHLAAPERASTHFATIKQFMADHGAVMTTVILLLLGAKLLGDGISGLL